LIKESIRPPISDIYEKGFGVVFMLDDIKSSYFQKAVK
jgi:hypothetical protein